MDDRTRFAKCFRITTENCKVWAAVFLDNVLRNKATTLKQCLQANNVNDPVIKNAVVNMRNTTDLDVSSICKIIRECKLLEPGELQSVGPHTVGSLLKRIRLIRNDMAHTVEAKLDKQDYDDLISDFKDIATYFERVNKISNAAYRKDIEKINEETWADSKVEDTIKTFDKYIENIINYEMRKPVKHDSNSSYAKQLAGDASSHFTSPLGQALAGIGGGALGLSADLADYVFKKLR